MATKHTLIGAAGNPAGAQVVKLEIWKRTSTQGWPGICLPKHDIVLTIHGKDRYLLQAHELAAQTYDGTDGEHVNNARTMMKDIEKQIGGEIKMQELMKMVSKKACVGTCLNGHRVMLAKYGTGPGLIRALDRKLTSVHIWESVEYAKASGDELNAPLVENV
ncbi:hypothetical protein PWT90_09529 [Aphanocladium album]|nr:hypothetical protein PWT90_09529 [Aphanocladium album]